MMRGVRDDKQKGPVETGPQKFTLTAVINYPGFMITRYKNKRWHIGH
jgi:hypothetical protein